MRQKVGTKMWSKKGWGGPLRRRQHLREEPRGHFVILRYRFSPADLKERAASLAADAKLLMQTVLVLTLAIRRNKTTWNWKVFCVFFPLKFQAVSTWKKICGDDWNGNPTSVFCLEQKKAMQTEVAFRQWGGGRGRRGDSSKIASSLQEEEK